MAGFWAEQKAYWVTEAKPVPESRAMRRWVYETGSVLGWLLMVFLASVGPAGQLKGWDAAPLLLVLFGASVGAYRTGGFGIAHAIDKLTRKPEKAEDTAN